MGNERITHKEFNMRDTNTDMRDTNTDAMKKEILMLIICLAALAACEGMTIAPAVPDCLIQKIKELKDATTCPQGASVKEYKFRHKTVYVLSMGNCTSDSGVQVIDADCQPLGFLGGFTGNTKINGIEFSSHATFIRTVWEN